MLFDYILNIARTSAWLAIKTSSDPAAKVGNLTQITIDGVLIPVLAQDIDLSEYTYIDPTSGTIKTAALTVEDDFQTILTVYADRDGAVTVGKGAEVTKHNHYIVNDIDKSQNFNKAVLGFIYIKNETGSQFVWGTTELDASNLTVLYTDTVSPLGF